MHDAIPAGNSIKTQRQTTAPKRAEPKPGRAAPVLRKAADGTSRWACPAWTRLMPAPRRDDEYRDGDARSPARWSAWNDDLHISALAIGEADRRFWVPRPARKISTYVGTLG